MPNHGSMHYFGIYTNSMRTSDTEIDLLLQSMCMENRAGKQAQGPG